MEAVVNYTAYFWDGPADGRTEAIAEDQLKWDIMVPVMDSFMTRAAMREMNDGEIPDVPLTTRIAWYRRTYLSERLHRVIYEFAGMHR